MTKYASTLDKRFATQLAELIRAVRKLQMRLVAIDSGAPLAALPAVVDASYESGNPLVYINGSAALAGPCQYVASYTPAAGDAVLVLPTPQTAKTVTAYIILGKLD